MPRRLVPEGHSSFKRRVVASGGYPDPMVKKTGTSMGGGIVRVKRAKWPDKNAELCPVCKATRRNPCRDKRTNKLMYKTHTGKKI